MARLLAMSRLRNGKSSLAWATYSIGMLIHPYSSFFVRPYRVRSIVSVHHDTSPGIRSAKRMRHNKYCSLAMAYPLWQLVVAAVVQWYVMDHFLCECYVGRSSPRSFFIKRIHKCRLPICDRVTS